MSNNNQTRYPWLAEFCGTAILVMTVVGSGIMATNLTKDIALQLLVNTIPTGAILIVLITLFGPISGAHFNPVVSMVFWLQGSLKTARLLQYTIAQCIGGIIGTILAHMMFDLPALVLGTAARTGPSLWLSEAIATFTLLLVILGTAHSKPDAIPVAVGLTITATYWFTASTSFANPAVTLARSFTQTFSGINITHVPMFVIAQCLGAVLAMGFVKLVFTTVEE